MAGEWVVIGGLVCTVVVVLHWLCFEVAPQAWRDRVMEIVVAAVKPFLSPSPQPPLDRRVMLPHVPPKNRQGIRVIGPQFRTGSPQPDHRITVERDIIKRPAYQELTADQVAFVEQCFTLNAILPRDKQFSCRNLYRNYGGTREKRMAELSAIKDRVEKNLQAERLAKLTTNRPQQPTTA